MSNDPTLSFNGSRRLPVVLAITGASGAVYAARTLQWLLIERQPVHLVVSPDGLTVIRQELGFQGKLEMPRVVDFLLAAHRLMEPNVQISESYSSEAAKKVEGSDFSWIETIRAALDSGQLQIHQSNDYFVPIASGSYRTSAMVICPCSGTTMAAIAHASGRNLIHRAAEVHLKERRKLILVPRETPLSVIQIENMLRVSQAGAVVLPAAPGWYHGVSGLKDLVDFVAARILDQLDISHERVRRWS
jgi:flavin prenyltransferase